MTGQDLFNKLTNRLGKSNIDIDFVSAINMTSEVIVKRLWASQSDFLRTDFSVAYTQDNALLALPTGFLGFVERPYLIINGSPRRLSPLPPEADDQFPNTGIPEYYEMRGASAIKLYPTPNAGGTLLGRNYQKPADLTVLSDNLPFGGFFDNVFVDALLMIAQQGMFVASTPLFEQTMAKQVDVAMSSRAPRRVSWRKMP